MPHQHSSLIKTPKQLVTVVVLAFVVPVLLIILIASYAAGGRSTGQGTDSTSKAAIAERLKPIGTVTFADSTAPAAEAPAAATLPATVASPKKSSAGAGEQLYQQACSACHAAGIAGAPKLGDKAAWAPRLALGLDGLTANVIKGKGAMPPRGAAANASDADLRASVAFMIAPVK